MADFDPFDETRRDDPAWRTQFKLWAAGKNRDYHQERLDYRELNPHWTREQVAGHNNERKTY